MVSDLCINSEVSLNFDYMNMLIFKTVLCLLCNMQISRVNRHPATVRQRD